MCGSQPAPDRANVAEPQADQAEPAAGAPASERDAVSPGPFAVPEDLPDPARFVYVELRDLAGEGLTLRDALLERWPDGEWSDPIAFDADAAAWWQGVDAELRYRIQVAHRERWTALRGERGGAEALVGLCDDRLAALRAVMAGAA